MRAAVEQGFLGDVIRLVEDAERSTQRAKLVEELGVGRVELTQRFRRRRDGVHTLPVGRDARIVYRCSDYLLMVCAPLAQAFALRPRCSPRNLAIHFVWLPIP